MSEETEPGTAPPTPSKKNARLRPSDVIIFTIIAGAVVGLSFFIYNKMILKRDVNNAQAVADKANLALQKRNGAAAWKLGDKEFQQKNSADALQANFNKGENLKLNKSTLERQVAFTSSQGRTVYFIYRYDDLKVPYFIRIGVHHEGPKWFLVNMASSADESRLL